MTTPIQIGQVRLVGTSGDIAEYAFGSGINVIHGETGSGKTSLLQVIRWVLGGKASLSKAVQDGVESASVRLRLGTSNYLFSRELGQTSLSVFEPDGTLVEVLASTRRRKHMRRSTDFLIEASGLPAVRLSSQSSAREEEISFWDYYEYMHLRQSEIDRSVMNHEEFYKDRKRKTVFELLLGLSNVEIAALKNRRDAAVDRRRSAERRLSTIQDFLDGVDILSAEETSARLSNLRAQLAAAQSELQELRQEGRHRNQSLDDRQFKLRTALEDSHQIARRIAELQARVSRRVESRFELESERERLTRGGTATDLLGTLEFHQCPRCLQAVEPYRFGDDDCYLCGQDEPRPAPEEEADTDAEFARIDGLLAEVDQLVREDRSELQRLTARRRGLDILTRDLGQELDRVSEEYVGPLFEEIAALGERIGRLRESREALAVNIELWGRHTETVKEIDQIGLHVAELEQALEAAEATVERGRERLSDLSDLFDEIIEQLDMPWYSAPARIDSTTYLPIVNGVSFEELSSGGMKMMTNVAYHLALLTYGLAEQDTRIPSLLIIDSPRKNLGATPEDVAHTEEFYNWIDGLVRAYTTNFQIIIADNDPPPDNVIIASEISVSHANPVVPGVIHPGPGVELLD